MVTTRRGTETPGQDSTTTPRSSGKRKALKRELEALDTPTAAKRQKKTTPKKKVVEEVQELDAKEDAVPDSAEDTSDTVNIAIPRTQTPNLEDKLPIRRRSSPKVVVAKPSPPASRGAEGALAEDAPASTQEDEFHTPEPQSDVIYATPATQKKGAASPTPRAKRAIERTSSAKKSSGRKKAAPIETKELADEATPTVSSFPDEIISSTYEGDQAPTPTQDAPPKKAHLRFGSEDPEETTENVTMNLQGYKRYEAPATTKTEVADSDDDASDSDEAPEVVTTSAAASKAKASQQDAARALVAQQEKERVKREAREQRIAEEQAEKRKREEKKAKKLAKQLAKQQPEEASVETSTPIDLSGLLPSSLLSNLPDQRAPTPPPARGGKTEEELRKEKLRHHIKFLERTDKGPKDVEKGKLSVAVLGQQNKVLTPKANRATRNVREKWLKGRQVEAKKGKGIGGKMERKAFGNRGFLRGDD